MPWHEWRLAGRSGKPAPEQYCENRLEQRIFTDPRQQQALSELEMQVNVVDEILKMTVFEEQPQKVSIMCDPSSALIFKHCDELLSVQKGWRPANNHTVLKSEQRSCNTMETS